MWEVVSVYQMWISKLQYNADKRVLWQRACLCLHGGIHLHHSQPQQSEGFRVFFFHPKCICPPKEHTGSGDHVTCRLNTEWQEGQTTRDFTTKHQINSEMAKKHIHWAEQDSLRKLNSYFYFIIKKIFVNFVWCLFRIGMKLKDQKQHQYYQEQSTG